MGESQTDTIEAPKAPPPDNISGPSWDYTSRLKDYLKEHHSSAFGEESRPEQKLEFQGRTIISRDTSINDGVYMVGGTGEAIVVDDQKQPELEEVYQDLLQKSQERAQREGTGIRRGILSEVLEIVKEAIPYDQAKIDQLHQSLGVRTGQKIALGAYISQKGGVCRHQALLAAYLLERLGKEGYVNGKVSVDRNFLADGRGHAWVRYTNSFGKIFIIDPAQNYIGRLNQVDEASGLRWFYKRPEDQ